MAGRGPGPRFFGAVGDVADNGSRGGIGSREKGSGKTRLFSHCLTSKSDRTLSYICLSLTKEGY